MNVIVIILFQICIIIVFLEASVEIAILSLQTTLPYLSTSRSRITQMKKLQKVMAI